MKRAKKELTRLSLKKVTIAALNHPELEKIQGGISGNCPPPSALRTKIGCAHPTTTVQHTFDC